MKKEAMTTTPEAIAAAIAENAPVTLDELAEAIAEAIAPEAAEEVEAAAAIAPEAGEPAGEDFPALAANDYPAAAALIENCLTHAAKMIDARGNAAPGTVEECHSQSRLGGGKLSAASLRFSDEAEELTQEAWLIALDRASNPKYAPLPLRLYLCKAAGKALAASLYTRKKITLTAAELRKYYPAAADGTEPAPDAVIDGKVEQKTFPAPGFDLMRTEYRERILAEVGEGIRERAAAIIADIESGYTTTEAARRQSISPRRGLEILESVRAAAAYIAIEDGEAAEFERICGSDEKTKAAIEKARKRAATIAPAAAIRARDKERAAARAAMQAAPAARLNAAAYMAMMRAYKPNPAAVPGKRIAHAPAPDAAAVIPAAVIAKDKRNVDTLPAATLKKEAAARAARARRSRRTSYAAWLMKHGATEKEAKAIAARAVYAK